MKGFVKDPQAILDYSLDWGPWLDGDTLTSSAWVVDSPLAIVSASEVFDSTTTSLFISGGVAGQSYDIINTITTAAGRTDERTIELRVRQR